MSPLIELFAWICLGWAFIMSTGLFILEGINYRKTSRCAAAAAPKGGANEPADRSGAQAPGTIPLPMYSRMVVLSGLL